VISIKPTLEVRPWIAAASYLVQLSDEESFGYSLVEALCLGVPVVTTDIEVLPELGVIDGVNGYIIPFDGPYDEIAEKIYKAPIRAFKYHFDNDGIIKQWRSLLGEGPKKKREKVVRVQVLRSYNDMSLGRSLDPGMIVYMKQSRAAEAIRRGLVAEML